MMGARPRLIVSTKDARAKPSPSKVTPIKAPPTKVQVYLTKVDLGAALEREAKLRRLSLSQAAEAILERGLKGKIDADPGDRLLMIERRLSDHMRLTARDLFVVEEMLFIALRTLMSRLPEHPQEREADYKAEINIAMDEVIDELARKVRQGRMQFEAAIREEGEPTPDPEIIANDAAAPQRADRDL
jgi:hypothetical protein